MQVDADDPVGPGRRQHVGDQLGGDRLAPGGLAVLAGVAVVGADGGDPLGRGALGGVDHDQLLHDRVVHRSAVGLDDEDVTAADRDVVAAVDLAVGELAQVGLAQLDAEVCGDLLGQGSGASARTPTPAAAAGSAPRADATASGREPPKGAGPAAQDGSAVSELKGGTTSPSATTVPGPRTRRARPGPAPDGGRTPTVLRDLRPLPDLAVDKRARPARSRRPRRPWSHPGGDAGQERHVRRQLDLGVDVGALGVPHRHASPHPALVDAVPQLGLGHRQLGPVVDAGRLHGVGHRARPPGSRRRRGRRPRR